MYNVFSFYLTERRENQNGSSEKMLQNKRRKTYQSSFRTRAYFGKNVTKANREKKLGRTCLEFEMLTNIAFANILIKTKKNKNKTPNSLKS